MTNLDQELIVRALIGADDQAFNRLVTLHQSVVRGFLRRLTKGDAALADDLAQETFFKAYTRLGDFKGEGRFQSWLLRIAYTMFLQHKRRRMNTEQPDDTLGDLAKNSMPAPPIAARLDLERAMAQLSEQERASLTLCFTYGMSHTEVAATLDLPLGTVKSHISRGREKLKQSLAVWQGEVIS